MSPEKKDLSCKGSLAEGEAHYFTEIMYQSRDWVVNGNFEEKNHTVAKTARMRHAAA
jgi:hypothetical protein